MIPAPVAGSARVRNAEGSARPGPLCAARGPCHPASMVRRLLRMLCLTAVVCAALPSGPRAATDRDPRLAALVGNWRGQAEWNGSRSPLALSFTSADSGRVRVAFTIPALQARDEALGRARLRGDTLLAGPFVFVWDSTARTLTGVLPRELVPVHAIPVTLTPGPALVAEPREPLEAPAREPVWRFEAGAALWSDLEAGMGLVFAGGDDGVLHAVSVRTGRERWRFVTGGRLRARPTLVMSSLYVHSDDGWLYRLDAGTGKRRWRVRLEPDSVVRIPIDQPGSRYDFYGSGVAVWGGTLYVGTHDGRVLALDPTDGHTVWSATTGGPVLATPGLADGRVFVGSYDGRVYAFDAGVGEKLWSFDTGAAVTATPVPDRGVVVIGSRSYDLFGLDAVTGEVRWNRYLWYSWIESSARIADGIAYVGSSDASRLFALDTRTGSQRWESDLHGISWGRPAVTFDRVYAAVRYSPSIATHEANLLALDRESGRALWRYACDRPAGATHRGFGASPVVANGRVLVGGLDGTLYAFEEADPVPGARRPAKRRVPVRSQPATPTR